MAKKTTTLAQALWNSADDVDPYASALLNQFAYDQSDSFDAYLFG